MNFALTMEMSELVIKNGVSDYIQQASDDLSEFFKTKDYGEDLLTIYIGIICVSPEFDSFYKIREPRHKKGNKTIIQAGRPYQEINALTYDVKLDYRKFVNADENEAKKMLSIELLSSFIAFDLVKIKAFDRKRFEDDAARHLNRYIQ